MNSSAAYPTFTIEKLEKGYFLLEKHHMEDIFDCFRIPKEWKIEKKIPCLDVFRIVKGGYLEIDGYVEKKYMCCEIEDYTNALTDLAGCGSCYEASCYIYQLIKHVQKRDEMFENAM